MTRKMRPADGCTYPLKPAEVHKWFPGVGHVGWWENPMGQSGKFIVFGAGWYPESPMRQPVLTINAVHTEDIAAIRVWFETVVWQEARAWLKDVERRAPQTKESETWWFDSEAGSSWFRPARRS
jgi:hypothetical protein